MRNLGLGKWAGRWGLAAIAAIVASAQGALAQQSPIGSRLEDWLETPTGACTLLPPKVVTTGTVAQAEWSSDGRYLLISRHSQPVDLKALDRALAAATQPPRSEEASIELYDTATQKTTVVWKTAGERVTPGSFTWLHGGAAAVLQVEAAGSPGSPATDGAIALFRTAGKTLAPIHIPGLDPSEATVWPVPGMSLAVVQTVGRPNPNGGPPATPMWTVDPTGTVRPIDVPAGFRLYPVLPAEGQGILLVRNRAAQEGQARTREAILFNPATGRYTQTDLPKTPRFGPDAGPGLATMEMGLGVPDAAVGDDTVKITLFWQSLPAKDSSTTPTEAGGAMAPGAPPAAPIASITVGVGVVDSSDVAPDGRHVSFQSNGVLFVRPIWTIGHDVWAKMRPAMLRSRQIGQAKQVALGFIMYASDNDDRLPDPGTWQSDTEPYLQDASMLDGFVYSYNGTLDLAKVETPAETVLGYVPGEGGRAVAYLDGHVRWVPDPPKT